MKNANILLIKYSDEYKQDLADMLVSLSSELFGFGTADVESFVQQHTAIYLVLKGDEVIGFSSFVVNTYYGLRPQTLGNTYCYVKPTHRNTKAMTALSVAAGYISINSKIPLETYFASKASKAISRKLKGSKLYDVYLYEPEDLMELYNKLFSNLYPNLK